MVSYNTSMKTAYDFLKQHDPRLADALCSDVKYAANRLKIASDLKRKKEDEYDASIWQLLTRDRTDVLRPFDQAIYDEQTLYGNRWDNLFRAVDDIDNEINLRRESEIETGNFIYYRVVIGTNIRKSYGGIPIIFESLYSAECAHDGDNPERVISVAAYNRLYGSFMED